MNIYDRIIYKSGKIAYILSAAFMIAALLVNAVPAPPAFAATGSVWTTAESCTVPDVPQNQNHYYVGQIVYVRGSGFDSTNVNLSWAVTGPNGESPVWGSGSFVSGTTGSFCVETYHVTAADVGREMKFTIYPTADPDSKLKSDNFSADLNPLSLVKNGTLNLGTNGIVNEGDTISYSLVVTNNGKDDLTNVSVTDPLLVSVTCPDGNPFASLGKNGGSVTCTGTYTILLSDITAGKVDNTATADSNETLPVTASFNVPLTAAPALSITKTGSLALGSNAKLDAGDLITYTILVTNTGNIPLTNVTVVDSLVSLTCVPTIPASFNPGASLTCSGSYPVTLDDIISGNRSNTAEADSDETEKVTDSYDVPLIAGPALSITKTGSLALGTNAKLDAGDLITYTVVVTNTGNIPLTSVTVVDSLVSLTCVPTIPVSFIPGASLTCGGSYPVTLDDIISGNRSNTAEADSDETLPVTASYDVPLTAAPALSITKTGSLALGSNAKLDAGDQITYTVVVTNSGNIPLTSVTVVDSLVSLTCVPTIPASFNPGASLTCSGSYAVTFDDIISGNRSNTAEADSVESSKVTASYDVPLTAGPALFIIKTGSLDLGSNAKLDAGDLITYAVLVANSGNIPLTDVTVVDSLVSLTCEPAIPVSFSPGASLACSGSYAVTLDDIISGNRSNTAEADSDETEKVTASYDIPLTAAPALSITKTASLDLGDGKLDAGDLITYTVVVTNTGNIPLTGVTVSDPSLSLTCEPGLSPFTIIPGASVTCTGIYSVLEKDILDGNHLNTATADSTETPPVTTTIEVPLSAGPALSLVKTGSLSLGTNGTLDVGDLINYTLVVKNIGNITLTGVAIIDPLLGFLTCPVDISIIDPGASKTCTGIYAITQADINARHRSNTAIAGSNQTSTVLASFDIPFIIIPVTGGTPGLSLTKNAILALGSNGRLDVGDVISYTLVATNTGNTNLSGVTVSDPLVSLTCTPVIPASLSPGASIICTGNYNITQADINSGHRANTGLADSLETPPVTKFHDEIFSVDTCNNIEGLQTTIPTGYQENGTGGCVLVQVNIPVTGDVLIPVTGIATRIPGNFASRMLFLGSIAFLGLGLVMNGSSYKKTDSPNSRPHQ